MIMIMIMIIIIIIIIIIIKGKLLTKREPPVYIVP